MPPGFDRARSCWLSIIMGLCMECNQETDEVVGVGMCFACMTKGVNYASELRVDGRMTLQRKRDKGLLGKTPLKPMPRRNRLVAPKNWWVNIITS